MVGADIVAGKLVVSGKNRIDRRGIPKLCNFLVELLQHLFAVLRQGATNPTQYHVVKSVIN